MYVYTHTHIYIYLVILTQSNVKTALVHYK